MRTHSLIAAVGITLLDLALAHPAGAGVTYSPYVGFVAQLAQAGAPDGQISLCMQAGPPEGTPFPSVALAQCSTSSPDVVTTYFGQITIAGQCLAVGEEADVGAILDLEPCEDIAPIVPSQLWTFEGGVIENQSSGLCLEAAGDSVTFGTCNAFNASTPGFVETNLFVPINYSMAILSQAGLCLTDLKQNYNSNNADTAVKKCVETGTWPTSHPNQLWTARFIQDGSPQGFSLYDLTSNSDSEALDVYDNTFSGGLGTVDMADPRSPPQTTLGQHWYFNNLGAGSPTGFSLIQHGSAGECLDIQSDGGAGAPVDAYLCNSSYGDGNNAAQQWQAVIPGSGL